MEGMLDGKYRGLFYIWEFYTEGMFVGIVTYLTTDSFKSRAEFNKYELLTT